jgi:hypothetical protein
MQAEATHLRGGYPETIDRDVLSGMSDLHRSQPGRPLCRAKCEVPQTGYWPSGSRAWGPQGVPERRLPESRSNSANPE